MKMTVPNFRYHFYCRRGRRSLREFATNRNIYKAIVVPVVVVTVVVVVLWPPKQTMKVNKDLSVFVISLAR